MLTISLRISYMPVDAPVLDTVTLAVSPVSDGASSAFRWRWTPVAVFLTERMLVVRCANHADAVVQYPDVHKFRNPSLRLIRLAWTRAF